MKKLLVIVLVVVIVAGLFACTAAPTPAATTAPAASVAVASTAAPSAATAAPASSAAASTSAKSADGMKIAYFVSDNSNTFHQGQGAEAIKYAKSKYNADVTVLDGKSDANVMTQNVDLLATSDYNGATLHIWQNDAALPGVKAAIKAGVAIDSFFSPFPMGDGTFLPEVRNDEAGVSFEMGKTMAEQWKKANPSKPIVCVELGWPDNADVKSGRTDPFVKGVMSVDPSAKDLGCLDASKGADAAKQITLDLMTQHPEVNLIDSEAGNLTPGTMAALVQSGRGTMKNGVPTTEIVCSCDCPDTELKMIYDPNSSLKASLGLPPIETAHTRIDNVVDIYTGKVPQTEPTNKEILAAAKDVNYWTVKAADAVTWYNTQFGATLNVADIDKSAK